MYSDGVENLLKTCAAELGANANNPFSLLKKVTEYLAEKFGYKPLEPLFWPDIRDYYADIVSQQFFIDGSEKTICSKEGTPICNGYTRIVIGDYGPYIEFTESQRASEFCISPGQEWRYDESLPYTRNIKYYWLTPKDNSNAKIYLQKNTVDYADYIPGRYYVAPWNISVE